MSELLYLAVGVWAFVAGLALGVIITFRYTLGKVNKLMEETKNGISNLFNQPIKVNATQDQEEKERRT